MAHQTREQTAQLAKVLRHKTYYLRGGDITFLVENHLFRVHSYFFDRESTFFHQKLSAASPPGEDRVGATDGNAFTLENVRSIDLERFLWVFYNPKYSLYDKTAEEWTSILQLSNQWSFVEVKNLAVRELEKLDIEPIERVYIYHRYHIDRAYLITSYAAICTRPAPLNLYEGRRLGLETALKVAEARERIRAVASEQSGARSPTFADFIPSDVDGIVREVFEIVVRSNPLSGGGGPPSATNGSHSRPGSNAWPPAQIVVTTPPASGPSQQQQQQYPFSSSFSESFQNPAIVKPYNTGLDHFIGAAFGAGTQLPPTGPDARAQVQSPVNGAGSQLFTGGPGEPPLASAGEQAAGVTDNIKTPVDATAEATGGGEGGGGSDELETPVNTTEKTVNEVEKTVAQNPFAALGADGGDDEDEDDDEQNEGEDGAGEGGGEGEQTTDGAANGSFRKQEGGKGGKGRAAKEETTTNGEKINLGDVGPQGVGDEGGGSGGRVGEEGREGKDAEVASKQRGDGKDGGGDITPVEQSAEVIGGNFLKKEVEAHTPNDTTIPEVESDTAEQRDSTSGEGHRGVGQVGDRDASEVGNASANELVKQAVNAAGSASISPDTETGDLDPARPKPDVNAQGVPHPSGSSSQSAGMEHDAEQASGSQSQHAGGDGIQDNTGVAVKLGENNEPGPTDAVQGANVENTPPAEQGSTPLLPPAVVQSSSNGVKVTTQEQKNISGQDDQDVSKDGMASESSGATVYEPAVDNIENSS